MESRSELESRRRELRKALADVIADQEKMIGSIRGDDEAGIDIVVTEEHRKAFDANRAKIAELRSLIDTLDATLDGKRYLDEPERPSVGMQAEAIAAAIRDSLGTATSDTRGKTVGQLFIESDEFRALDYARSGLVKMDRPFTLKIADLSGQYVGGRKDVYTDLPTGTPTAFGAVTRDTTVERARRTLRIRDLFNVIPTESRVIEFFRVTGYTNAASVVPERSGSQFAAKPHTNLTFEGRQAVVRTIAHWEAAHRNTLADEPSLRAIIDNELLYGLQLREDQQILSGTGSGEDLPGILNDSAIQTYNWSSGVVGDNKADALRRAMTLVTLANYPTTGIVLHPDDMEDIELAKSSGSEKTYLFLTALAVGVEPQIHRVPVSESAAISAGVALVGAFGLGAQLYDREEATIRTAEQHEDFFVRNAVVILAEERLALAVKRPEAFVRVNFNAPPS